MEEKKITVKITTGTFARLALVAALVFFAYLIRNVVVIVLLSVVIATGIEPAAAWFQKRKIPHMVSVLLSYLIIFAVLGLMFYMVVPTIFTELSSLNTNLSASLGKSLELDFLSGIIPSTSSVAEIFRELTVKATDYLSKFAGGFFALAVNIFGGAVSFVMVVVLSFYLSVQEKGIENFLRIIIPLQQEEYVIDIWKRASHKIGLWFQGQILLGVIVGVLAYLGLTILGVEYALVFAILAGVFELIPVFGPILSAVPPVLMALTHSPGLALGVIILYFILQQFENHLIYPLVVRKIIGIPPIIVIIALIIGGQLNGILGMLLAVPLATVLTEILTDLDARKHAILEGHKKEDECVIL